MPCAHSLANWQQWVLIGFAFFFGFGAPLICWGAVADPIHPHVAAHFLFFEPPVVPGSSRLAGHLSTNCNAAGFVHGLALPSVDGAASQEPTGAARPPVTLISILLLTFVALFMLRLQLAKCLLRIVSAIYPWDFTLPVLTPPPRFILVA